MKRTLFALALAGLLGTTASAQTITPGIGGIAITGNSGAGVYLPWGGGGATIGAPGVGSYNLGSSSYQSPFSWSNYSNPTDYNFNTNSFNYQSGYYSPWTSGSNVIQSGYNYPSNSSYYYPNSSTYYPASSTYYPSSSTYYPSSSYYYPSSGYSNYTNPAKWVNGRGRVRFR